MAAEEGFEPSQTESESGVLPLHNSAKRKGYYTCFFRFVKRFLQFLSVPAENIYLFSHPQGTVQLCFQRYALGTGEGLFDKRLDVQRLFDGLDLGHAGLGARMARREDRAAVLIR